MERASCTLIIRSIWDPSSKSTLNKKPSTNKENRQAYKKIKKKTIVARPEK
jgi:hypothetical protein